MKPLKEARLSLRLSQALKEKLEKLERETGILPTILAVEGLAAICRYYETKGVVTMPFSVVPTPELKTLLEPPAKKIRR